MELTAVIHHYEVFCDDIIARNKTEIAMRLKEARFEEDFTNSLFQTSRAASSVKSSTALLVKTDQRRRRSASEELYFVARQSTHLQVARPDYNLAEASPPTGNAQVC